MADVGTLQRLPRVVGNQSWARDLVYTARKVSAEEALKFGLVRCVAILMVCQCRACLQPPSPPV